MVEIFPIMVTLLVIQLLSGGLEKNKTNSQWSLIPGATPASTSGERTVG